MLLLFVIHSLGAELEVRVTPKQAAVQQNVQNYIGSLGDRDEAQLVRYSATVREYAHQALQALGYYRSQIETDVYAGQPPRLMVSIQTGPPVRLRQVRVQITGEASQLPEFHGLDSQLKSGQPLHHGHYEATKQRILTLASHYGFFDGRFTQQQLRIDPEAGTADIDLIYQSGPRYRFTTPEFTGQQAIDERLLHSLVPFQAGTPYNSALVAQLNQNLQSSNYFSHIQVDAHPTQATSDHRIPVKVQLTARTPRSMGFGLGFSTDVGPRLRFDWSRYWSNPQGHRYGAEAELSAVRQNVGFWYEIPRDPPLSHSLRYAGGYQYQEIADTDSMSRLLTFGPEWRAQLANGWQRIIALKWQQEQYRLGDDSGSSTLFMPSLAYNILHSDHPVDPSHGYRLEGKLAAAKKGLLSNTDLVHSEIMLKGLTTFAQRHRLLGRLQLGANLTDLYHHVPPSQRFFAGGDQSVRGYDYQTLSPTNSDNEDIGGRYLLAASAEYQYRFAEKWRLATFVDQGNAFDSLTQPALKTSLGLGLRWISPVGPLRLDVAHPLDGEGGVHFHFSMGPEL